jgi:hypothetical protein
VIVTNNAAYVIDCGDGVARQLVLAGMPLRPFVTSSSRTSTQTTPRITEI